MMDKKPHIKPYLYGMLAGFGAISLSILFFFLIYRFQGFGDAISKLTGILMPFIYGAVIAYLLKPVCNCVEDFLCPKRWELRPTCWRSPSRCCSASWWCMR
jgi:hypothetical protein